MRYRVLLFLSVAVIITSAGTVPPGGKCAANADCIGAESNQTPTAFCMRREPSGSGMTLPSYMPPPIYGYCVSAKVPAGFKSSTFRYYGWLRGTGLTKSGGCDANADCPAGSVCLERGGYSCIIPPVLTASPPPPMYYQGELVGFYHSYDPTLSVLWGQCPSNSDAILGYGHFLMCTGAPRPCDESLGWFCADPTKVCNPQHVCVSRYVTCTTDADCAAETSLTTCDPIAAVCKVPAAPGETCDQNNLITCTGGSVCQANNVCRIHAAFGDTCAPPSANYVCTGVGEACALDSTDKVCRRVVGAPCAANVDCLSGGCDIITTNTCQTPVSPGGGCGLSTQLCIGGGVCQPDNVCRIPRTHGGACDYERTITCIDSTTVCAIAAGATVGSPSHCLYSLAEECGTDAECATPRCAGGTCKNEVNIGGTCTDVRTTVCIRGADCRRNPLASAGVLSCQIPRSIGASCANPAREYCADPGSICGVNTKVSSDRSSVCVLSFRYACGPNITTDGVCDNMNEVCDDITRMCLRKIDAPCSVNSDCAQTYDFCKYGHRNCQQGENRPTACRDNGFGRKVCLDMPPWLGRWCDPRCPTDNDCKECRSDDTSIIDAFTNCTAIGLKLAADQATFEAGTTSARRLLQDGTEVSPPVLLAALGDTCAHPRHCATGLTCRYYNVTAEPGSLAVNPTCVTPDTLGAGCLTGWPCTGGLVCAVPAQGAPWAPCVAPYIVGAVCNPVGGCGNGLTCNATTAVCERCPAPVTIYADGMAPCPPPPPPASSIGGDCGGDPDCIGGLICDADGKCANHFVPATLGESCPGGDASLCANGLVCPVATCLSPVGGSCSSDSDCANRAYCYLNDWSDPGAGGVCGKWPLGESGCLDDTDCVTGLCRRLIYDEQVPPPPPPPGFVLDDILRPVYNPSAPPPAESARTYCLLPYVHLVLGENCYGDAQCGHAAIGNPICAGMPIAGMPHSYSPDLRCRSSVVPLPLLWACTAHVNCSGGLVCDEARLVCVGAKTFTVCNNTADCVTGYCDTTQGRCAGHPMGASCLVSEDCAGALTCEGHFCTDPLPLGAPCGVALDSNTVALCGPGLSCAVPVGALEPDNAPRCVAPKGSSPVGCSSSNCTTGYCAPGEPGTCAAFPLGHGCTLAEDCAGILTCVGGFCKQSLPAGALCGTAAQETTAHCGLDLFCTLPLLSDLLSERRCLAAPGTTCLTDAHCHTGRCDKMGACASFPANWECVHTVQCAGDLVCRAPLGTEQPAPEPTPEPNRRLLRGGPVLLCLPVYVPLPLGTPCTATGADYECGAPTSGLVCGGLPLVGGVELGSPVCRTPVVPLPAGWGCTLAVDCAGGLVCEADRDRAGRTVAGAPTTCRTPYALSPLGAVCVVSDTCEGGHSCVYGRCATCAHASLDTGSACTKHDDCVFGTYCPNATCVAVPLPLTDGSACTVDNDCDGRICRHGACLSPKGTGGACRVNGDCKGGLICIATVCDVPPLPLPLNAPCNPLTAGGAVCDRGLECDNGISGDLLYTQATPYCRLANPTPNCHTCFGCPADPLGGAQGAERKERERAAAAKKSRRLLGHVESAPVYHTYLGYDTSEGDWDDLTGLIHDWKVRAEACEHPSGEILPPTTSGPSVAGIVRSGKQDYGTVSVLVGIAILILLVGCALVGPMVARSLFPRGGRGRTY